MSFATGFVTGLAGTLADGINQRTKDARDYFEKQVDYARTTGLANRNKVKQTVDQNLSTAQQLQQVGVPKNIIMAQINMNPAGLADFYNQAEGLRASAAAKGKTLDWSTIYEVAGDFKAPDEDMATFISRTYDPIAQAVNSPGYEDSPKESLIASMMGFNSMDRARRKLGDTQIAEGLSAEQLIQYGDTTPQRVGGRAIVTTNYGNIPGKEDGDRVLRVGDLTYIIDQVREEIAFKRLPEGADATEVRDGLLERMLIDFPTADPAQLLAKIESEIRLRGFTLTTPVDDTEGPGDASTASPDGQPVPDPTTGSPTPVPTPVAPVGNTAPIDLEKEPELRNLPGILIDGRDRFLTFVLDNGDGSSTWIDEGGEEFDLPNGVAREARTP